MSDLYQEKDGQLSLTPVIERRQDQYSYHGPVFYFDQQIAVVKLKTWAVSLDKAYSNMIYQAKEKFGYQRNAKLTITKNMIKKEELKYGKIC